MPFPQNPRLSAARMAADSADPFEAEAAQMPEQGQQLVQECTCPQCGYKGPMDEFHGQPMSEEPSGGAY